MDMIINYFNTYIGNLHFYLEKSASNLITRLKFQAEQAQAGAFLTTVLLIHFQHVSSYIMGPRN